MRRIALLATFLLASGCDSGPGVPPIRTAPVDGVATFGGKPLEGYRVHFFRSDGDATEPATGRIDAEGRFTLSVRRPGDGAVVGKNSVWLTYDPELLDGSDIADLARRPPPKVALPKTYQDPATSGLTVDVPDAGLSGYRIELR